MLAYVFWHWPRSEVRSAAYENALTQFYRALKSQKPDGFIDCFGLKSQSFPWHAGGSRGYEDWYLVDNFQSLGVLNEVAVSHEMKDAHNRIASLVDGGAGGIYKGYGKCLLDNVQFSAWFAKPPGMSYQDLRGEIESSKVVEGYWQRQMVLGPAPEFCVHSSKSISLPRRFQAASLKVRLVR